MTVEEIRQTLHAAARVKMPLLDSDASLGRQVEQVQDHLLQTAIWRCDLERARLYAYEARDVIRDQWDEMPPESYEALMRGRVSKAAAEEAKATVSPELRRGLVEATRLIDRLTDQIKRLEVDDKAASRLYTMLVGG